MIDVVDSEGAGENVYRAEEVGAAVVLESRDKLALTLVESETLNDLVPNEDEEDEPDNDDDPEELGLALFVRDVEMVFETRGDVVELREIILDEEKKVEADGDGDGRGLELTNVEAVFDFEMALDEDGRVEGVSCADIIAVPLYAGEREFVGVVILDRVI